MINTPEGQQEFSAVQAVKLETTTQAYDRLVSGIAGPDAHAYFLQGQAPYIELASGHLLIALIMGSGSPNSEPGRMALTYLGDPSIKGPENDEAARAAFEDTAVGVSVAIPRKDWPYIVVIPPNGDFAELQPVNGPSGRPLETLVGPGYAVKAVLVEKSYDKPGPIDIDTAIPCLREATPVCPFHELAREVLMTRYVMGPRSYLNRTMQR